VNGKEISVESFRKIRELLYFRNANHLTKTSEKFRKENQMERNSRSEVFENLVTHHEIGITLVDKYNLHTNLLKTTQTERDET